MFLVLLDFPFYCTSGRSMSRSKQEKSDATGRKFKLLYILWSGLGIRFGLRLGSGLGLIFSFSLG